MTEIDRTIETTRFVNIDDKPFDIYINNKLARHFEPGEEQTIVVYVAQVGAKHLVDRVLQEKHNVKDTLHDTELRRSFFAKILPDMAVERNIKPLSEEEEREAIKKELARQSSVIESLSEKVKSESEKEKEIAELRKEIETLKKATSEKKVGRPLKKNE